MFLQNAFPSQEQMIPVFFLLGLVVTALVIYVILPKLLKIFRQRKTLLGIKKPMNIKKAKYPRGVAKDKYVFTAFGAKWDD